MEDLGFLCDPAANKSDFLTSVSAPAIRTIALGFEDLIAPDFKGRLAEYSGLQRIGGLRQALIGGSLFYNTPDNTTGLFIKGGLLFFSLLYPTFIALAEVTDSFVGRPVITDIPIILFQISYFGILINLVSALAIIQLFRLIGAAFPNFDVVTKASGFTIVAAFTYIGYMIPKPDIYPYSSRSTLWLTRSKYCSQTSSTTSEGYSPEIGGGQVYTGVRSTPPRQSLAQLWYSLRLKQIGEGGRGLLIPHKKQKKVPKAAIEKPSENSGSDSEKSNAIIDNQLVNNTSPGTLGTLMGSLGRKDYTTRRSSSTYVEQIDIYELLFTNREIPREEKLRYIDTIIKLLQLEDLEHTLIGHPSTAVLVTIHQPSADLFAQFDTLLLLAKGSKTIYFSDIGYYTKTVKKYFANYSALCPREANPTEHIIEVVLGSLSKASAISNNASLRSLVSSLSPPVLSPSFSLSLSIVITYIRRARRRVPFVTSLIVSKLPYLVVYGTLYFMCWYWTTGLPNNTKWVGSTFFVIIFYEMLYTGIRQSIAMYAPSATFVSLVNPLVITTLVLFCASYELSIPTRSILTSHFRLYYLDPFNYLFGAFLTFTTFSVDITCERGELAVFNPPTNETCGDYLSTYQ
ncbi:hypothetical protein N7527_008105 [Penicillium freii]|nr:hypothetical protein N7527_008105 [Penicillium freii]